MLAAGLVAFCLLGNGACNALATPRTAGAATEAWHVSAPAGPPGANDHSAGGALVDAALRYLGRPYRHGGQSLDTGVDCASFVRLLFQPLGVDLPFTAAAQLGFGTPIAEGELLAGDLVFFRDTYKRGISHVGVYIGSRRFVHASGRRSGVIVSSLEHPYYRRHFAAARRLLLVLRGAD